MTGYGQSNDDDGTLATMRGKRKPRKQGGPRVKDTWYAAKRRNGR